MAEEKLVRGISRWSVVAIVINSIVGAGIFGLPSKVAALIGSYSLIAFVICTVIIAFVVVCFAEVSSCFTETGGPYLYAKEAYGSLFGFEVGWLMWIARVTTFAANCNLLLAYLGFFVPLAWAKAVTGDERRRHEAAARDSSARTLEILEQINAQKMLPESDREWLEKLRANSPGRGR